ncbi:hypothetical protein NEF87_004090 [Candidatus Lokiarchaeum ossiferum]|uniref:SHSP domain-containing protein n=1 Tax=Candidatus Lokiarchaeum ossiferum TaxID=2951803 RepID=A0ABY6HWD0_9ARCH|nr:hypothetical protein NEF87_004090 [Candidatus Lokiarchaeum sp. B-35]
MEDIFDQLDAIIKKMFENLNLGSEDSQDSYSISYRFKSGMDEPEIKVNGELKPEISEQFNKLLADFTSRKFASSPINEEIMLENKNNKPFVDIFDEENHFLIVIELPGIDKKDISLISISSKELELKALDYVEIITLPQNYISDSVKARYKNGVLEITILKDQSTIKTSRIEIN